VGISRTIAKNTFFNFIITATDVTVSFLVSILLARGLGAEQYGIYAFLMWFMSLAALVVNLGLGEMTRRYVAEAIGRGDRETPKGIVRMALMIRSSATLIAALLIVGLSGYLAKIYSQVNNDNVYFMLVALAFFPAILNEAIGSVFAGFQKYEYGAYIGLIFSPLRLVGVIILMSLNYGVKEILIMVTVIGFLGLITNILFMRRLVPLRSIVSRSKLDPAIKKDSLKYTSTFIGIQGVSYFLWSQAEVFFLSLYTTAKSIGFYNLAFRIPQVTINLVPFVLGRVLLPTVAEQFGKGDMNKIRAIYITSARYLMMLTFPLVAGGIALAAPIIHIFYGMEYHQSIALMQIIFIPFSMMGLIHASTSVIYAMNKPSFVLKSGLVIFIVSVALYFWMIPRYGVIGAAIASSIPRIAVFPIYNYYVYKKIGVHWPFGDSLRVVLAAVIMGASVFGVYQLLGDLLGLIVGIPLGVLIYFFFLVMLRFATPQEINLLRKVERRVPALVRGKYASLVDWIEALGRKESLIP
jgi:O-antigen/teichoic acid export membrane protein